MEALEEEEEEESREHILLYQLFFTDGEVWECSCREKRCDENEGSRGNSIEESSNVLDRARQSVCMRNVLHGWIPQKYHSEIYRRASEHLRTALYFVSITAEVERDPIVPLLLPWLWTMRCNARCTSKHNISKHVWYAAARIHVE